MHNFERSEDLSTVLRIRILIRWIRKILASWIRIPKNMRIHESGSKGQNINQKLQENNFTLKTQIWTIEKRDIRKISWFLNGSSSFGIKIRQQIWKFCFVKKIQ